MRSSSHSTWIDSLQEELDPVQKGSFQRQLLLSPSEKISFASNDYLGLARDPRLAEAATHVLAQWGTGAQSARLISGHTLWHEELEDLLAHLKNSPAALTFPTGYAAATGTIPCLLRPGDYVLLDKCCHACLFDGAKLSGAKLKIFAHNDLQQAGDLLRWIRQHSPASTRILVVVESLYSMDGDFAPLKNLIKLKNEYGAWLMVDEAHATGLYGPEGKGLIAAEDLSSEIEVQMGTLSKAIGVHGGFIAGSSDLVQLLLNQARSFLFTTGTPPALAAAASRSIRILQSPEGDSLRDQLRENIALYQKCHSESPSDAPWLSPIQLWKVGEESAALKISQDLFQKGFLVPAIRYPTVPRKEARLRMTLTAAHQPSEIRQLSETLTSLSPP